MAYEKVVYVEDLDEELYPEVLQELLDHLGLLLIEYVKYDDSGPYYKVVKKEDV